MTTKEQFTRKTARGQVKAADIANKAKGEAQRLSDKTKLNYGEAKAKAERGYNAARASANEAAAKTREKGTALYESSKAKASARYAQGKEAVNHAGKASREQVERSPLAVLAGGLTLGAIVAALIPGSDREKKVLGPTGRKLNSRAKDAAGAAKERGQQKVEELGLTSDALKEQLDDFVDKGIEILKSAGKAAGEAMANKKKD